MTSAPQAALLDGMDQHSHPQSEVRTFACNLFFFCSGWWRLHTFFVYATIYLKAPVALSFLYKPEDDVLKLFNAAGLLNVKFFAKDSGRISTTVQRMWPYACSDCLVSSRCLSPLHQRRATVANVANQRLPARQRTNGHNLRNTLITAQRMLFYQIAKKKCMITTFQGYLIA